MTFQRWRSYIGKSDELTWIDELSSTGRAELYMTSSADLYRMRSADLFCMRSADLCLTTST